jgi:uncharacterized protein YfdQ (DUF2303 family)
MSTFSDLILRTVSTLIATLTTVIIITERQRRINNAKIELAAHYIESIDDEAPGPDLCKGVIKDLHTAEELIRQITWGQISRASKIDDVVRITRKLERERQKHEKLQKKAELADPGEPVRQEIERKKFEGLAARVRALKISFIDFVFIGTGRKFRRATPPQV